MTSRRVPVSGRLRSRVPQPVVLLFPASRDRHDCAGRLWR